MSQILLFFHCLFGRKLTVFEEELYYQASLEWRKEIAVKGKGCVKTKSQFVEHVLNELKQSTLFEGITKNQLDLVSAISQPFLLSPQINFSDILVTLFLNLHKDQALFSSLKSLSLENKDITSFILESMLLRAVMAFLALSLVYWPPITES